MQLKLKYIFILIVTILMTGGITLVSIILIASENKAMQARLQEGRVELRAHLAQMCKEALIIKDDLLLVHYIRMIKKTHADVLYAYVITAEGAVLSDMPKRELVSLLGKNLTTIPSGLNKISSYMVYGVLDKIVSGKNKLGTMYLGFDHQYFLSKLLRQKKDFRNRIFIGVGISLVVGIVMTLLITQHVFAPIKRLSEGVRIIGQGVLTHRIPVESNNELGLLAREFNYMAEQLQKLDDLKNNFISSVSHELKTPLSAIKVYVELFQEDASLYMDNEKRTKALTIIHDNIDRLTLFISDLLDLARIRAGKLDLCISTVNIEAIVKDIVSFCRPLFEKNHIRIIFLESTSPLKIKADPAKVRQVITNLIGNALKFTPSGGEVVISYDVYKKKFLKVSITDTGIGIPTDQFRNIFEQFKKIQGSYGPEGGKTKGTGLGLSICKGIVEAQGGTIWVESVIDKGSTFHFILPLG